MTQPAHILNPNAAVRGLGRPRDRTGKGASLSVPGKKVTNTNCGTVTEPDCTPQEQSDQLEAVNELYAGVDQDYIEGLDYPTTLQSVLLCDGSVVYLLADQLDQLPGDFTILNQMTINGPDDLIEAYATARDPNPLFALELDYERNGNIEEARWKTTYHSPKKYEYQYDEINRIKSADYSQIGAGPTAAQADDLFSVSNITYDGIGNIQTLTCRGMTGCGPDLVTGEIDVLTYQYFDDDPQNVSRLRSITDDAGIPELATQGVNTTEGGDYGYDGAGRMTDDPYRGLTIRYNHLDLPREIDSPAGLIQITYDANGQKRLYHVKDRYTRRYAGPLTFEKKHEEDDYVPEAAATGDGRLVYDAEHNEIYPEYHHKDHLGNVRVVFTDRNRDKFVEIIGEGNEVEQIMDFYPFGLAQRGEGVFGEMAGSSNRLDYNGKEMLGETGLIDYGARWYDGATGRWGQVDPLAESYANFSTHIYVGNNPIKFIDPDGRSIKSTAGGFRLTGADAQSYFKSLVASAELDTGLKSKILPFEQALANQLRKELYGEVQDLFF